MMLSILLNTQPGWACATLEEARSHGIRKGVECFHHDSSVVVRHGTVLEHRWRTPSHVCGCIVLARGAGGRDATANLVDLLSRNNLKSVLVAALILEGYLHLGPIGLDLSVLELDVELGDLCHAKVTEPGGC